MSGQIHIMNYDDLPEAIKKHVTRKGWEWTPDKERLVDGFINPEPDEDLIEDDE
jgi:hypothetical protein